LPQETTTALYIVAASSLEPLELMQRLLRLAWQTHENINFGKYLLASWQNQPYPPHKQTGSIWK
jgi:hypothetical protein